MSEHDQCHDCFNGGAHGPENPSHSQSCSDQAPLSSSDTSTSHRLYPPIQGRKHKQGAQGHTVGYQAVGNTIAPGGVGVGIGVGGRLPAIPEDPSITAPAAFRASPPSTDASVPAPPQQQPDPLSLMTSHVPPSQQGAPGVAAGRSVASQVCAIQRVAATQASRFPHAKQQTMSRISRQQEGTRRFLDTRGGPIATRYESAEDVAQATRMADAIDAGAIDDVLAARDSAPGSHGLRSWIHTKQREMGFLCPGGRAFHRHGGGWECDVNAHYVPDAALATGISMMYLTEMELRRAGFDRADDPDVFAAPPAGQGIPEYFFGPVTQGLSLENGMMVWDVSQMKKDSK